MRGVLTSQDWVIVRQMLSLKSKARSLAAHLPEPAKDLLRRAAAHLPAPLQDAVGARASSPTFAPEVRPPEDRLVVIYATLAEAEDTAAIRQALAGIDAVIRVVDLEQTPHVAKQLAGLTGRMVPPYVYINGRPWGNRYDIETLRETGDLQAIVDDKLDQLSEQARQLGHIHEAFSDALSADNILARWKLGHILCVDDLDAWFEVDKHGNGRFFYQGAEHAPSLMADVAAEIAARARNEELEATWQLEPTVHA